MTPVAASNLSSFGVVNEAEQQILTSEGEEKKTQKASINDQKKSVEKLHEQRQENFEKRLHMLASGHAGCLKFLKVITMVASAIAAPLTAGASVGIATAVIAALTAVSGIVEGLGQLEEAMQQKKLVLNKAEGQQILMLIQDTQKWIDDSKSHLDDSNTRERDALDQYSQQLIDLETSFKTMIQIENK